MPYRVLMIAPTSFFLDYGAHVRILEEVRVLQKSNHKVKIVTYPLGRDIADLDIERSIPIPWRSSREVGPSRSKLIIDIFLALKALTTARRFKPDLIHAHLHEGALIGGALARWFRIPLVFDLQGSLTSEMVDHRFISPKGVLFSMARWLERQIDQLPRSILTSSQNAAQGLMTEFQVPADRLRVIHDCVHADTFAPSAISRARVDDLRAQLQIPLGRKIVIYIGLLDEYRGTSVMLRAAAHLRDRGKDIHFVIIGFPNVARYSAMARDLGIADRVAFTGRIPYEHVPLWLSLGDVAVEPKMSATEAAGKVLDYMAMGLPIVAFDIPVMNEYLGDLGVYAPLGDAEAMADQLAPLLDDPARSRSIGSKLRERAMHNFSWERAGREIEAVYQQVLSSR
jgi:glycosyltransferase involved in cell wall biosynthesis